MKTYVITLSKRFPVGHERAGKSTMFKDKFLLGISCPDCSTEQDLSGKNISLCNSCQRACMQSKIHTIRANYPLWEKRIAEVERGDACLSIRQWTGKPYRSKQEEIASLTASDGIGIQMLSFAPLYTLAAPFVNGRRIATNTLASNDGLRDADWREWFMHYDLTQPMAIIHFTKFRY